jgi:osmotically-inducible protein OsmY
MADNRWREDDRRWRDENSTVRHLERGQGRDYGGAFDVSPDRERGGRSVIGGDYGDRRSYDRNIGRSDYGYDPYASDYDRERRYDADYPGIRGSDDHDRYRQTGYLRGTERGYGNNGYGNNGYGDNGYGTRDRQRGLWDRASDEVSSWMGDEDAERRREMDGARSGHYGRGPIGYTRSDDRIQEDINDRLTYDWNVDASNIGVAVSGSEVTLSGTVTHRSQKRRAEDIAENVSGVTQVQNNIRVQTGVPATSTAEEATDTGSILGPTTGSPTRTL